MAERKAVVYLRVSTEEQAENGTSLETQEAACLRKAADMGATVNEEPCRDEGVSGTLYDSRKGIQAALRAIETGRANILIASKIDRIGRSAQVVLKIAERVDRAGGELVTCDGMSFGNSATGRLTLTLLAAFAEFERNMIRERTMTGCRRTAEKGKQPSRGRRPYGYELVTERDVLAGRFPQGTEGTYILHDEESAVIAEVFNRYDAGASLSGVCAWLNGAGFRTSKGGACWRPRAVMYLLENPVYKGTATHGRRETFNDERRVIEQGFKTSRYQRIKKGADVTEIPAPAIVSESVWNRCQERLKTSRADFSGNPRRVFLLSGLARCPVCGRGLAGLSSSDHQYYLCNRTGADAHKPAFRIPAEEIEPEVIKAIVEALSHPASIEAAVEAHRQRLNADTPRVSIQEIRAQLAEMEKKENTVARAQVEAMIAGRGTEVYDRLLSDYSEQRQALEKQLAAAEAVGKDAQRIDPGAITLTAVTALEKLQKVLKASDVLTNAERRHVIRGFVKEIVIDPEQLRVAFHPFTADETVQITVVMYHFLDLPGIALLENSAARHDARSNRILHKVAEGQTRSAHQGPHAPAAGYLRPAAGDESED